MEKTIKPLLHVIQLSYCSLEKRPLFVFGRIRKLKYVFIAIMEAIFCLNPKTNNIQSKIQSYSFVSTVSAQSK